jgi:hypothetical protein
VVPAGALITMAGVALTLLGAWPAVVALALALLAVCGGLTLWLRQIPALTDRALTDRGASIVR